MLETLVDNFIKYASVYSQALRRYVGLYGKDVTFMKLPNNSTEDPYLVALGKQNVSFDYENPLIKKVPAKLIVDYADFYRRYQVEEMQSLIYFSEDAPDVVTAGDLIMYHKTGIDILIYRITDPVETYARILYRATLKLVQNKHVKPTHEERASDTGVII